MEPKQFLNFLKDVRGTVEAHHNAYKGILSSNVNQTIHCVLYDLDTLIALYSSVNEDKTEKK